MSHVPISERQTGARLLRRAAPNDAPALAALRYTFRTQDYPATGSSVEEREAFLARCVPWMTTRLAGAATGTGWQCWFVEVPGTGGCHLWLQAIEKISNPIADPCLHA